MADVKVYDQNKQEAGTVTLAPEVFEDRGAAEEF